MKDWIQKEHRNTNLCDSNKRKVSKKSQATDFFRGTGKKKVCFNKLLDSNALQYETQDKVMQNNVKEKKYFEKPQEKTL